MAPFAFPQLGEYEVRGQIGTGAHSTIHEAVEQASGRRVAIKHVVRRGPEDDRFLVQTENEYEIAHQLDHPYLRKCHRIIRVRKWFKTRELFVIMELVDGDTLEHECPRELDDVTEIFIHIADGLHAMHMAGFAHADFKPKNVLLSKQGGPKIIDFGQSCPLGHQKTRVQGTPAFMAPEQVARHPIDQRTDVFSLGASMYWVVTGKEFKTAMPSAPAGTKKVALADRVGSEPPHEVNRNVPPPLSRLIMDCCDPVMSARPGDMRAVISRLETIQHLLRRGADAPAGKSGP